MSKYTKQHFIPASYLKAWCDSSTPDNQTPYVWMFSKDGNNSKKKAPHNIFHESHIYTIQYPGMDKSFILEKGFSQLEGKFDALRKKKLNKQASLSSEDKFLLSIFTASMKSRTKAYKEHHQKQWKSVLDMMDMIKKSVEEAPDNKKHLMAIPSINEDQSISYEETKQIAENPIQHLTTLDIDFLSKELFNMDMLIFCTDDDIGFITSDDPCVWVDPEIMKRPPYLQHVGLVYPSIQITLPISPKQILLFNKQGINGYFDISDNPEKLDALNRRTRWHSSEYFIVNCNKKKTEWFK